MMQCQQRGSSNYLLAKVRHVIPQHIQQLAAVLVTVNRCAPMALQLLLDLPQTASAALVCSLSTLQLLLLGLHGRQNKYEACKVCPASCNCGCCVPVPSRAVRWLLCKAFHTAVDVTHDPPSTVG